MTGNRALLKFFTEKFLGMVRFGNDDFVVIAGYGDVVVGSMTIKKVYYVEGLGHNLFSIGQFCDKGLEVAFRKSTCFVRSEDGVDLLTDDRSLNLYIVALNDITSNLFVCLLAKAFSSQSWLWHQRLSHLNFSTINNLVKNNLVRGLPKMKFEKDHLCLACKQGKIHRKHHKSKTAFASNKLLYHLHMDLFGPMRVKSINEKRYITKSPTTNVETSNEIFFPFEEEVFHEISESFQEESSLSSLNDDVQQSSEEVTVPSSNTQSVLNEIVPNVNEVITSHNAFNERFEDAYFDVSTTFHDPSNVHTFYQPYPHDKKWTKDHPLYKIIGDPKSSVSTREQGIDYDETFAPVAQIEAIYLFLAYVASKNFTVFQMDAKMTFLNEILKEEVFVGQPPGFVSKKYPNHVYTLDKALYSFKQAPRA
ncbi:integrase, catalytic region, zinc finger, CCHC-type containing protein, partial [Tanacetum coccineum]